MRFYVFDNEGFIGFDYNQKIPYAMATHEYRHSGVMTLEDAKKCRDSLDAAIKKVEEEVKSREAKAHVEGSARELARWVKGWIDRESRRGIITQAISRHGLDLMKCAMPCGLDGADAEVAWHQAFNYELNSD